MSINVNLECNAINKLMVPIDRVYGTGARKRRIRRQSTRSDVKSGAECGWRNG